MFGFKYWVISVEVPLILGGKIENQRSREMWYTALNFFMIAVNTFFCVWVSFARYKLSVESAGMAAPRSLVDLVSDLYHVITALLFISAIFLADALRRIKKSLTTNPHLI